MTPRLSVVVPFYNVERYIADCLDSLARQTFGDFEVILVDDGSKDAGVEVARRFCSADRRFRLVTQENQGLGPARNTGVRHAEGDYLTFVDSDDLVPRHAYEIMVRSLDETSSSLAAGNARRFNNTSGVRQSYVHRLPFVLNRPATHIFDLPTLALDRMVWNKVFRRTFWEQFGYEFPAIRYEDYPVTLGAHIDAVTTDVLAAPVYYWRERESGESITQRRFQHANLADRVISAEMVFDLLDERAPELRGEVHAHFVEIDLATLVQAFASADDDELEPLVALARRFSSRLDPAVVATSTTMQRLEYEAVQAGDTGLLRRLARYREEGGLRRPVPARRHPTMPLRFESRYPGLREGSLPPSVYELPRHELNVHSAVTYQAWTDDALVIRGTAEIAHLPAADDATLRLSLVCGRRSHRLPVERLARTDPSLPIPFETRIPRTLLASLPSWASSAHLAVAMRVGWVRRRRFLAPGGLQYPVGAWVGDRWVQPVRTPDNRLTLQLRSGSAELTAVEVDGDDLVLTGRIPSGLAEPRLHLARSAGDVRVPVERRRGAGMDDYTARVPLEVLIDAVNPDDPFLERTVLVPRIHDRDNPMLILVTGLNRGVLAPRGDRVVSVSRSPGNYLNLVEGPARVTADQLSRSADGLRLTVSGPCWPGVDYREITWRRFLPNSDDAVDAPGTLTRTGDRWSVEADATTMTVDEELPNWTLFAVPAGRTPYAVQSDAFLLSELPIRVHEFHLRTRSGILHLETD